VELGDEARPTKKRIVARQQRASKAFLEHARYDLKVPSSISSTSSIAFSSSIAPYKGHPNHRHAISWGVMAATSMWRSVMGDEKLARLHAGSNGKPSLLPVHDETDVAKLLEENAQLRELVIQLTKIAIKNIVDPARGVR
jgi:hypothetical protein